MKKVRSRDDLLLQTPRLKKLFFHLAEVMVAAESYMKQHPEETMPAFSSKDHNLSDQLRAELNRIYQLEGGKDTIDQCQKTAHDWIVKASL